VGSQKTFGHIEFDQDLVDRGRSGVDRVGDVPVAQRAVAFAVLRQIQRDDRDVFALSVGPDIAFGPRQNRMNPPLGAAGPVDTGIHHPAGLEIEDTQLLKLALANEPFDRIEKRAVRDGTGSCRFGYAPHWRKDNDNPALPEKPTERKLTIMTRRCVGLNCLPADENSNSKCLIKFVSRR
jgi:hypothetical protein